MCYRIATCVLAVGASLGFAQAPARPAFDVASIKPSDPAAKIAINRSGYHLATTGTSLLFLVTWAYDVHPERVVGQPKWLDSVRYDVVANATQGEPVRRQANEPSALQKMMQALLAERFKLAIHRETRELPMYALVAAKDGPKFELAPAPESMNQNPFSMPDMGTLIGTQVSAEALAKALANQLGRSVVDETGLKGVFDFKLLWAPEMPPMMAGSAAAAMMAGRPSLFTAVQEQLGLKLEARKGKVEVLVIDHIENVPTEN
jgi:uncharacterized protein (TIGR03435 family)